MDSKILQSVIDITKQRDLDSLDSTLVATLAELLPVTGICILKYTKEDNINYAEEVISLAIDENKDDPYFWSNYSKFVISDEHLITCINTSEITTYKHEKGFTRHLFPISDDSQVIECLIIDSDKNLSSHMELIKGFTRVYQNYMIVFNESERDKLTGLFNRRTFDKKLSKLFKEQQHQSHYDNKLSSHRDRRLVNNTDSAWLIITDIDLFKRVNDSYGHIYGDEVILTISQIMKSCFRNSDLLFRIGGDEFVILLGPAPINIVRKLLNNFLKKVEEHAFSEIGTVTLSAGYAQITEKNYPPAVLENADKALYFSKEHGHNCAHNYEELVEQGDVVIANKSGTIDMF